MKTNLIARTVRNYGTELIDLNKKRQKRRKKIIMYIVYTTIMATMAVINLFVNLIK